MHSNKTLWLIINCAPFNSVELFAKILCCIAHACCCDSKLPQMIPTIHILMHNLNNNRHLLSNSYNYWT